MQAESLTVSERDGEVRVLGPVAEERVGGLLLGDVPLPQQLHPQALGVEPALRCPGRENVGVTSQTERDVLVRASTLISHVYYLLDGLVEVADAVDGVEEAPVVLLGPRQGVVRAAEGGRGGCAPGQP